MILINFYRLKKFFFFIHQTYCALLASRLTTKIYIVCVCVCCVNSVRPWLCEANKMYIGSSITNDGNNGLSLFLSALPLQRERNDDYRTNKMVAITQKKRKKKWLKPKVLLIIFFNKKRMRESEWNRWTVHVV